MAVMTFTKTVLKNLFSAPATTQYPAVPREYPERTRGHIEIDIDKCIFCGMCMRSCPPGCITVVRNDAKWKINRFDCVQCGYCTEKCPKQCLSLVPGYQTPGTRKLPAEYIRPGGVPAPAKPAARPAAGAAKPAAGAAANAGAAAAAKPKMTPEEIAALRAANLAKRAAAQPAENAPKAETAAAPKAETVPATEAAKPQTAAKPKLTPEQIAELRAQNLAKRAAAQAAAKAEEAPKGDQ